MVIFHAENLTNHGWIWTDLHVSETSEIIPKVMAVLMRFFLTDQFYSGESYDKPRWGYGDGSKPWYLVNPKIAGKWMFIPLKMVSIGIDPYPYHSMGLYPDVSFQKGPKCLPKCFVLAHQSAVNGFCCRCAQFTS